MVDRCWLCSHCSKPFQDEEDAVECEKKHEEYAEAQKKLMKENEKMRFPMHVKIKGSGFDELGGMVDFDLPKGCDLIILMGNKGGGYVPYNCLLPHQVYVSDLREDFDKHGFEVISLVGINSKDPFQIAFKDDYGFQRWSKSGDKYQKDVQSVQGKAA